MTVSSLPEITLRAPEPHDVAKMYRWENDAREWASSATRGPVSMKRLQDYVDSYCADAFVAGELRLIIADAVTGESVGCVDLFEVDAVNRRAGVGIVIDESRRRKGYGRAALLKMQWYAGEMLGLHQLWATICVDNVLSRALFTACGYKPCGCLRSWIRTGRKYADAYMYQLLLAM